MATSSTSTSSTQGISRSGCSPSGAAFKRSASTMDVSGPPAVANKRYCGPNPPGKPLSSPYGSTLAAGAPVDVTAPAPAAAALNVQSAPAGDIMDSPHSPGTEKLINFLIDPRLVSSPGAMAAAREMEDDFELLSPGTLNTLGWNGDDGWKRNLPSHLQFVKTEEDYQTLRVEEYSPEELDKGGIATAERYIHKIKELSQFLLYKHTTRREAAKPGYDRLLDQYVNHDLSMDTLCHARNGMLLRERREVIITEFHNDLKNFLENYTHKLSFPEEPPPPPAAYELVPLRAIRFGGLYVNHRGTTQGASSEYFPIWGVVARDDKDRTTEVNRIVNPDGSENWSEVVS